MENRWHRCLEVTIYSSFAISLSWLKYYYIAIELLSLWSQNIKYQLICFLQSLPPILFASLFLVFEYFLALKQSASSKKKKKNNHRSLWASVYLVSLFLCFHISGSVCHFVFQRKNTQKKSKKEISAFSCEKIINCHFYPTNLIK